jgi:hypothetical protein
MTISVVNGYVCEGSCDVAKARQGEDPHPATNAFKSADGETKTSRASPLDGPAVVFGGALAGLLSATAVTAIGSVQGASAASQETAGSRLDISV